MKSSKTNLIILTTLIGLAMIAAFVTGCTEKTTETKEKKDVKPVAPLTAEIKVDKSTAKDGDPLKYTMLIKNNTDKPMAGLKLRFVNPSGLDVSMSQEGGSQPAFDQATSTWTWDVGTVNAKGSYWITIAMKMIPGAPSGASISAQFTVESAGLASPVTSNIVATTIS